MVFLNFEQVGNTTEEKLVKSGNSLARTTAGIFCLKNMEGLENAALKI